MRKRDIDWFYVFVVTGLIIVSIMAAILWSIFVSGVGKGR